MLTEVVNIIFGLYKEFINNLAILPKAILPHNVYEFD